MSFLDMQIWSELLSHRFAIQLREHNLLRHIQSFSQHPNFPTYIIFGTKNLLDSPMIGLDIDCEHINKRNLGGLCEEQAELAIVALAQFHAFSLMSSDLCAGTFIPSLTQPSAKNEEALKEWLLDVLLTLPECEYFRNNERALRNFCHRTDFGIIMNENLAEKLPNDWQKDLPVVLCHGNFCSQNIVFTDKTIDGSLDLLAGDKTDFATPPLHILNWELAHSAYGISDLAYLLLSSVNSSIRLHNLDNWLTLYTQKFEQFRHLQQQQSNGRKSSLTMSLGRKRKTSASTVEHQRQLFHAVLPKQLLRALPKLAMEYQKLLFEGDEPTDGYDEINEKQRCALRGRMIGGFEMIRREFEE